MCLKPLCRLALSKESSDDEVVKRFIDGLFECM